MSLYFLAPIFFFASLSVAAVESAFVKYCTDPALDAAALKTLNKLFERAHISIGRGRTKPACESLEATAKEGTDIAFGGDHIQKTIAGDSSTPWSDGITDISVLRVLPHLTRVQLNRNENVVLEPLKDLPHLTALAMRNVKSVDLDLISKLEKLTYLDLRASGVEDLSALKTLKNLESLGISDTKVTRLSGLGAEGVARLKLLAAERVLFEDWDSLLFEQIADLNLRHSNIADLTPLKNAKLLHRLVVSGAKEIKSLDPIAELVSIEKLGVSGTGITDLKALARLEKLEQLNADHTAISDLTPLSGLKKLRRLVLTKTEVKDLSPLKDLQDLEWLDVQGISFAPGELDVLKPLTESHKDSAGKDVKLTIMAGKSSPAGLGLDL